MDEAAARSFFGEHFNAAQFAKLANEETGTVTGAQIRNLFSPAEGMPMLHMDQEITTLTLTSTTTRTKATNASFSYQQLLEPCAEGRMRLCFYRTDQFQSLAATEPLWEFRRAFGAGHLVVEEPTQLEILQGKLNSKYVVISHRWVTRFHPDPEAAKKALILQHLAENPWIEGIWIDFCCIPQGETSGGKPKTDPEQAFFKSSPQSLTRPR